MLRLSIAIFLGASLGLGGAPMLMGQATSYEDNALRIETQRGDMLVVRGANGNPVGKIGVFRGLDVAGFVASSEKAAAEARKFARDYRPGTLLASAGIATLGLAFGVARIQDVNSGITIGLTLTGIGLVAYGAGRLENAYNALERSFWWYNHDLKH